MRGIMMAKHQCMTRQRPIPWTHWDWLKSQGADVNAMADHDGTPMQYAEWLNSRDSLKWFMDNDGIETGTEPDETPQPV